MFLSVKITFECLNLCVFNLVFIYKYAVFIFSILHYWLFFQPPNNVQGYHIDDSSAATKNCFRIENNGRIYAKAALYVAPCNVQRQYNVCHIFTRQH